MVLYIYQLLKDMVNQYLPHFYKDTHGLKIYLKCETKYYILKYVTEYQKLIDVIN